MIDFTVQTHVHRPVSDVFAYVTDVEKLATWQTNTVSAVPEGDGPVELGTRICEVHRAGGKDHKSLVEVSGYELDRTFALQVIEGTPVHAQITFELTELGTDAEGCPRSWARSKRRRAVSAPPLGPKHASATYWSHCGHGALPPFIRGRTVAGRADRAKRGGRPARARPAGSRARRPSDGRARSRAWPADGEPAPTWPVTLVAFLDSSALVKLIAIESETAALRHELGEWPDRTASLLASIEVTRTARRLGGHAPALAARVLAGLRLLAIDPIVPTAMKLGGTTLRTLDAIHLGTAASISQQLGALITYDHRMIDEAQALGLPVLTPA